MLAQLAKLAGIECDAQEPVAFGVIFCDPIAIESLKFRVVAPTRRGHFHQAFGLAEIAVPALPDLRNDQNAIAHVKTSSITSTPIP